MSSVNVPIFYFYDSLVRLALCGNSLPPSIQIQHRLKIDANQRKMKRWARHSPKNYQHKYDLVEAEREKIKGHFVQAMNLYDSAIDLARTHGYLQEEALAFELASRFYTALNKPHLARPYMGEARYCYYRWGAAAKVSHLDRKKPPELPEFTRQPISPDIIPETFMPRTGGSGFDMATVVKASRILTEETTLPELLKKIMKIMLESIAEVHREIEIRRKIQLQLLHSEKLSALGRLSSSIAHEFGNPLIGIKYLLTDFLERPDLSREDQKLLLLGMEECDRMKKLLKDLGQLNRPTTGKKSHVNIHKIMDNVLFFQAKQIKTQQLKIVKNYATDLPDIFIIQDQISQVLLNLTINATDATSASGGTITVTTGKTAAKIFLSISDTGKGIDQNIQNKIFEPFFSTKREADGTGLGLSTSYGIIKRHGGQLTFVSEPDQGTTFTLSLPLTMTQPQ